MRPGCGRKSDVCKLTRFSGDRHAGCQREGGRRGSLRLGGADRRNRRSRPWHIYRGLRRQLGHGVPRHRFLAVRACGRGLHGAQGLQRQRRRRGRLLRR